MSETKSAAERRRERYAAMTPEQKEQLLQKNREYRARKRAESPAEYEAGKKERANKITERYRTDPEFRERRKELLRQQYAQLTPEQKKERLEEQRQRRLAKKKIQGEQPAGGAGDKELAN